MRPIQIAAACALGLVASGALVAGTLAYTETASVRVAVPAQRVEAAVTIHGAATGSDLVTQRLQVSLTESQQGAADLVTVPGTYATGWVVFSYKSKCGPAQPSPYEPPYCPSPPAFYRGVGSSVARADGTRYVLLSAATCFCGIDQKVRVRAAVPGTSGNTSSGMITWFLPATQPGWEVDNPAPVTGGTNSYQVQAVSQADLDSTRKSLMSKLTGELQAGLQAKARGLRYIADGSPTFVVTSDVAAGARTSSFTVTVTGTLGATAFVDADAQSIIRHSLDQKMPPGYVLSGDPVLTDYQVHDATSQGEVNVSGTVVGYFLLNALPESLPAQLRGLSVADARTQVLKLIPGSEVDIRLSPVPLPWLPMNREHINVAIVAQPPKH